MAENPKQERATPNEGIGYPSQPAGYGLPQSGYGPPPGTNGPPPVGFGSPQGGYGPPQGGYPNNGPPGNYPPPQGNFGPPQGTFGQPQGNFGPPQGSQYPPGPPITNQPMGHPGGPPGDWMHRPQNISNCPPGLEYLTTINNLLVQQTVEMLEVFSGHETENKYYVTNSLGQKVYFAREESEDCTRSICGSKRPFHMKIMDNYGNQVINLIRPLACQACCFPCCMQTMEVNAPPGTVVGLIEQEWNLLHPTFAIKSPNGDTILRIKGPWCTLDCYSDVEFKVLSADETTEVGKISKKWSGFAREAFTTADMFGISFPMDLDVRMKAVMLGACFLIDMMYFEQRPSSNSNSNKNQNNQNPNPNQPQNQNFQRV